MPGWSVSPSIRVRDVEASLAFYTESLGFTVRRGTAEEGNISLNRGDANLMLEGPEPAFYSDAYNAAIAARVGTPSAMALYMEAEDLEALHERLVAAGIAIIDPLAERPWGQAEFTVADLDGNWLTFYRPLHSEQP